MHSVTPFQFDSAQVRVISIDSDAWFVAKDVATALGYANPQKAVRDHCKAARPVGVNGSFSLDPQTVIIPERDLYRLVLKSHLPAAERFEEWVVGEVLPSIRKTGTYAAPAASGVDMTKVNAALAITECFVRLLRPAPSSQVQMLARIADSHGIDSSFLPAYAVDAPPGEDGNGSMPTKAVTDLLREHAIPQNAATFNGLLAKQGYLVRMSRKNSRQETVHFWSITEKGLRYGKNMTSPKAPRETQPHWYVERFGELLARVGLRAALAG